MAGLFLNDNIDLLRTGTFSDLVIECGSLEFQVHKAVVCAASPKLSAACGGQFKEAIDGRIKFPEEDPEMLSRAILYLYTGDYDEDKVPNFPTLTPPDPNPDFPDVDYAKMNKVRHDRAKVHFGVYKCADMLGVTKLKAEAAQRLRSFCASSGTLVLDADWFPEMLKHIYEYTQTADPILRGPMIDLCFHRHYSLSTAATKVMEEYEPLLFKLALPYMEERLSNYARIMSEGLAKLNSDLRDGCAGCGRPPADLQYCEEGGFYRDCPCGTHVYY